MRPGLIIVLNGTSSSGKSSIVEQLRVLAPEGFFLHIELDAFRAMEPPDYFSQVQQVHVNDRIKALCTAMQAAAAAYSRNGQNVIVDHVLSPQAWEHLLQDPEMAGALLVKVNCSLDVAEERERRRGNRQSGLARSQFHVTHLGRVYDFEVDTSNTTPIAAAGLLAEWLSRSPQAVAVQEMRRSTGEA